MLNTKLTHNVKDVGFKFVIMINIHGVVNVHEIFH
jgi:hypothetical protein